MSTLLYCFCKFYYSIQLDEKFKSWKFTKLKMLYNSTSFLDINN
jgi:hypothetical protein